MLAALTIAMWIAAARASPQEPLLATATGAIEGRVIAGDESHQPIRGATVEVRRNRPVVRPFTANTVSGGMEDLGDGSVERVLTGDAGEFRLAGLAPGQYLVSAAKAAYLRSAYRAADILGPGTPVVVSANASVNLTIPLTRGGVLTGVIRDTGQPTPDVLVTARGPSGGPYQMWTNHDGEFRIYGLPPGDYTLDAEPPIMQRNIPFGALPLKTATVDSVLAQLRAAALRGGDFRAVPTVILDGRVREPVGVTGYAPVYYPGTIDRRYAVSIPLAAGEERAGLDFELIMRGTARIRGQVIGPSGVAPKTASVMAVSAAGTYNTSANGGRFEFSNVPPGHYTLEARTIEGWSETGPIAGSPVSLTWWAISDVDVEDAVVDGVTLTLEPPMTFGGRVIFDGTPPAGSAGLRVSLRRVDRQGLSLMTVSGTANARGEFRLTGIGPGTFAFEVSGALANGRWLRSALVNGRDLLDAPLELGGSTKSLSDVAVTLTTRHTAITGTLRGATGDSAPGVYVLLFSAQPNDWHETSRRVVSTRPAVDGSFAFSDVPPGDYYIAALTTQPRDWRSPAFLSQIVNAAVRVTLHEGEQVTQELRLAR